MRCVMFFFFKQKTAYEIYQCDWSSDVCSSDLKCHGKFGRGGSMGNVEVGEDAWGYKGAAADLSSGMFRGGGRPIDIYRRIFSGINGTPMPAFEATFQDNPDEIWQLVQFIKATGERRRLGELPLGEVDLPAKIETEIEAEKPVKEPAETEEPAGEPATEEPLKQAA